MPFSRATRPVLLCNILSDNIPATFHAIWPSQQRTCWTVTPPQFTPLPPVIQALPPHQLQPTVPVSSLPYLLVSLITKTLSAEHPFSGREFNWMAERKKFYSPCWILFFTSQILKETLSSRRFLVPSGASVSIFSSSSLVLKLRYPPSYSGQVQDYISLVWVQTLSIDFSASPNLHPYPPTWFPLLSSSSCWRCWWTLARTLGTLPLRVKLYQLPPTLPTEVSL